MTYLLDTHIFVWLVDKADKIPQAIRDELAMAESQLLVSSISAMEVATKVHIGKWESARHLPLVWSEQLANIGADEIQFTTAHGLLAGALEWSHRDPFDRILATQSFVGNLTLVSADKAFRTLPGLKLLTW